jgi:hypothetical protein
MAPPNALSESAYKSEMLVCDVAGSQREIEPYHVVDLEQVCCRRLTFGFAFLFLFGPIGSSSPWNTTPLHLLLTFASFCYP